MTNLPSRPYFLTFFVIFCLQLYSLSVIFTHNIKLKIDVKNARLLVRLDINSG